MRKSRLVIQKLKTDSTPRETCITIDETVKGAYTIVLTTEWNQYRGLDLAKIRSQMRGSIFVDLRNVFERNMVKKYGFEYTYIRR